MHFLRHYIIMTILRVNVTIIVFKDEKNKALKCLTSYSHTTGLVVLSLDLNSDPLTTTSLMTTKTLVNTQTNRIVLASKAKEVLKYQGVLSGYSDLVRRSSSFLDSSLWLPEDYRCVPCSTI
jgi:hypothetical protein